MKSNWSLRKILESSYLFRIFDDLDWCNPMNVEHIGDETGEMIYIIYPEKVITVYHKNALPEADVKICENNYDEPCYNILETLRVKKENLKQTVQSIIYRLEDE